MLQLIYKSKNKIIMLTLRRFKIPLLPLIFTLCGSCFNDSSESIGTGNNELGLSKIVIALKANKNPELMLSEKLELEEYLSAKLKRKVDVLIPTDSSIIVESFRNGTLDIGYLSSTDAVRNIEQSTASLFLVHLKNGNPFYHSVWLSLKDKPYNSILDLESLPVSFASRSSTSGFLIPVYDLVQRGLVGPNSSLDDFFSKTVYGTGYVSAVKKVLSGEVEAAAVSDYVYLENNYLDDIDRAKLKIVQSQGPVPSHTLCIRSSISNNDKKLLLNAFLELNRENPSLCNRVFNGKLVTTKQDKHLRILNQAIETQKTMMTKEVLPPS